MKSPKWPLRYGVALLATALATSITLWIDPSLEYAHSALFITAVMIAAWFGGRGPGLLATVLATLAIDYFITPPYHTISSYGDDLMELILFFLLALMIGALTSRRRAAEAALREVNAALAATNVRLAAADKHKDEFLAMLSHELRNQLAPLRNAAQVLELAESDRAATRRQRALIDRQVTHMARLLDDLLDASRIGRGKLCLTPRRLDLREVVDQAVEAVAGALRERGHELDCPRPAAPVWIEGDPTRLGQVLVNLLLNAIKYSEPGSRIALAWGEEPAATGHGPCAVLRVRDNGIGIAPEQLPLIFELFAQAEQSPDHVQGGLGVGLALVRGLVVMHGGTVEARSAGLGQGSEFTIRLPLQAAPPQEQAGGASPASPIIIQDVPAPLLPEPAAGDARRLRVLVVDDVTDTALSLAELLELLGCETAVAGDGRQTLETARRFHPDLVLLDIGLPGENGYVVARRLRQEPGLSPLRLIALTGYGSQEDQQRSREAGFDHHLTKPIDLAALKQILRDTASHNEALAAFRIPA